MCKLGHSHRSNLEIHVTSLLSLAPPHVGSIFELVSLAEETLMVVLLLSRVAASDLSTWLCLQV